MRDSAASPMAPALALQMVEPRFCRFLPIGARSRTAPGRRPRACFGAIPVAPPMTTLLPQTGGFEGFLPRLVQTEADHLRFPQVADAEEVALDSHPATPARPALAKHENHRIPRIDVLAGRNLVVRPRLKPVTKEPLDSLVAVVDARRWQLARGRVPDHVGIEVLAPRLAITRLESAHHPLDDLHVLLRHRPRSIPPMRSALEGVHV